MFLLERQKARKGTQLPPKLSQNSKRLKIVTTSGSPVSGWACEEELRYVWSPICCDKDRIGFTMQAMITRFSGKRKTQDSETTGMFLTISKVPL